MFDKWLKRHRNEEIKEEIEKKAPMYMRELLQTKRKAIIILDPTWYDIKEALPLKGIDKKEKALLELLKEQGALTNDEKEYTKVKQNLMQQVLTVSQVVNEQNGVGQVEELTKLHEAIVTVGERLAAITERLEEIEGCIEEANIEIMEEVVGKGYYFLEDTREKRQDLEEEIAILRARLVEKTEEKKVHEAQFAKLYNYLHKIVGYQYVDALDKKIQKELEK